MGQAAARCDQSTHDTFEDEAENEHQPSERSMNAHENEHDSVGKDGRFDPIWVTSWDVRTDCTHVDVPTDEPVRYGSARVLVTDGIDPVGFVNAPIDGGRVAIASAAEALLNDHRSKTSGTASPSATATQPTSGVVEAGDALVGATPDLVSVIITTNNRPAELRAVLRGLEMQQRRADEVIIVDNGGVDRRPQLGLDELDFPVRYVQAPSIGMCFSRNVGARRAKGDLLVYLTDDAIPAPHWLDELVRAAGQPGVGAAYGATVPLRLENPGQILFEQAFNWSAKQGLDARILEPFGVATDPLAPYRLSDFPAGAQMALWRHWYDEVGGFDDAIGAGTLVRGGDDLDITSRLLIAGSRVALQPSALAWHDDDTTLDSLPNKMYAYGTGLFGFLMKHLVDPTSRPVLLRRIPVGIKLVATAPWNVEGIESIEPDPVAIPGDMKLRHFKGRIAGPLLYLRSRRRVARQLRHLTPTEWSGTELENS